MPSRDFKAKLNWDDSQARKGMADTAQATQGLGKDVNALSALYKTAMGTVIFPTLAALSELDDRQGKRDAMSGALRFIMIASIPSAVGLIFVGGPLVRLLERGALTVGISGSGPTVFAIADDSGVARTLADWLDRHYRQNEHGFVHVCRADLGGARSVA